MKVFYARKYKRGESTVWGLDQIDESGEMINKNKCNAPVHPKRTTGPKITQDTPRSERIEIFRRRYERGEFVTRWDELPESVKTGGLSQWVEQEDGMGVCIRPSIVNEGIENEQN